MKEMPEPLIPAVFYDPIVKHWEQPTEDQEDLFESVKIGLITSSTLTLTLTLTVAIALTLYPNEVSYRP